MDLNHSVGRKKTDYITILPSTDQIFTVEKYSLLVLLKVLLLRKCAVEIAIIPIIY